MNKKAIAYFAGIVIGAAIAKGHLLPVCWWVEDKVKGDKKDEK